jgi:hypothetical protein
MGVRRGGEEMQHRQVTSNSTDCEWILLTQTRGNIRTKSLKAVPTPMAPLPAEVTTYRHQRTHTHTHGVKSKNKTQDRTKNLPIRREHEISDCARNIRQKQTYLRRKRNTSRWQRRWRHSEAIARRVRPLRPSGSSSTRLAGMRGQVKPKERREARRKSKSTALICAMVLAATGPQFYC